MANRAPKIIPETPEIVSAATAHGRALKASATALTGASYDAERDSFRFALRDGTALVIPRANIGVEAIIKADPAQLRNIEIDAFGTHVWFPDLDEGVNPVGMFARRLQPVLQSERGQIGGSRKTPAKALASVANGAKGGRPKKKVVKVAHA